MSIALASLLAVSATVSTSLECIVLEGESTLVREVAAEISTQSPCREVSVTLRKELGRIVLQQADGPERHATTTVVAAAIIESWTNATIIAQVLQGPPPSPTPIQVRGPVASPNVEVTTEPEARPSRWGGLLRFEGGLAEDTSFNGGLLVRGDIRLARFTPWLGVRLGLIPASLTRDNGNVAGRTHGELLAGIELPLEAAGFVFAPGLAAGAGYTRTNRRNSECANTSCSALQGTLLRDNFAKVSFGPRIEIGLRVARQIVSQLAVDAGLVFSYSPLADRAGAVPAYAETLPEADQTPFALPAESRFAARLGLGLRWGVW